MFLAYDIEQSFPNANVMGAHEAMGPAFGTKFLLNIVLVVFERGTPTQDLP